MLLVVVFTVFLRGLWEIGAPEIRLADCQCAVGDRWGMQDISYKLNLLDFRKDISHEMAEKKMTLGQSCWELCACRPVC